MYWFVDRWGRFAKGTSNQALRVNSAGTDIGWGTLPVAGGGTGATTLTSGNVLIAAGTSPFTTKANPAGAFLGDSDVQNISGAKTFFNQTLRLRNPLNTFNLTVQNPAITADKERRAYLPYSYLIEKEGSGASSYYVKNMSKDCIDQSAVTANTAIQYAIDTLATGFDGDTNRHKGMIFVRGNQFYQSLDLTLKSGIWIVGEGDGSILTGKITVQDAADNCGLRNLYCYNTAADHVLYLNGVRSFNAENCVFYLDNTTLTKYPVLIDGGTNYGSTNTFEKCKIVSKGHGLVQRASAAGKYTNTTCLNDCLITYNGGTTATGGQIGLNFDGDAVEKNLQINNCYVELWDTAVSLDNGWCHLKNLWIDLVNTAGVDVTQASINTGSQYIDASTATVTTQPLLVLGGRKYYVSSSNWSIIYDNRSIIPNTAWIEKYLMPQHNPAQAYGALYGHNSGNAGEGLLSQLTIAGTPINSGDFTNGRWVRYASGGTAGDNAGWRYTGTPYTYRGWNPSYFVKMRTDNTAASRGWFGWVSTSTEPTGDDFLNALSGVALGWLAGDTNWQIITNDGTGATSYASTGVAIAANTIYTLEIRMEDTTPRIGYSINNGTMAFVTTNLPAQTTALYPVFQLEQTTTSAAKNLDRFHVFTRGDK